MRMGDASPDLCLATQESRGLRRVWPVQMSHLEGIIRGPVDRTVGGLSLIHSTPGTGAEEAHKPPCAKLRWGGPARGGSAEPRNIEAGG